LRDRKVPRGVPQELVSLPGDGRPGTQGKVPGAERLAEEPRVPESVGQDILEGSDERFEVGHGTPSTQNFKLPTDNGNPGAEWTRINLQILVAVPLAISVIVGYQLSVFNFQLGCDGSLTCVPARVNSDKVLDLRAGIH
jgi:hypothetical protein